MTAVQGLGALDFIAPGASAHAVAYAPDDEVGPLPSLPTVPQAGDSLPSFGSVLGAQLQQLDKSLKVAEEQSVRLAAGQAENLHQLMIDIEQARISLQLALQVRNRVLDAVQDLQRWQL